MKPMRLLMLGPEVKARSDISNFSGVWSYYLGRELTRQGASLRFVAPPRPDRTSADDVAAFYRDLDLAEVDHVIALGTRHFSKVPRGCGEDLMARCRGAVTQIHDSARRGDPVDCTFTVRDDGPAPHSLSVGWAADPDICVPWQPAYALSILIDHPDYAAGRPDRTADVMREVARLIDETAWRERFSAVHVHRIADGRVEKLQRAALDMPVEPYRRGHVGFEEICRFYGYAHIFMPTHREAVGLSVLESAVAGALTVAPEGFVPADRLATVRHVEYGDAVPWPDVLARIDVAGSRRVALANSWPSVAGRMLAWLEAFRR